MTFDNEKFSLEERLAPESGIRLTRLPRGAKWKHLALVHNDRSALGLNISVQFVNDMVANVDVFTASGEPVKSLKLSNSEGKCQVNTYIVSDKTEHVLYSRGACDGIYNATNSKASATEASNAITRAVGKIIAKERLSFWDGGKIKPVNSALMGDVLKYIQGCGRYSGQLEPVRFPAKNRPAPMPVKMPADGEASS